MALAVVAMVIARDEGLLHVDGVFDLAAEAVSGESHPVRTYYFFSPISSGLEVAKEV